MNNKTWFNGYTVHFKDGDAYADIDIIFDNMFSCLGYYKLGYIDFYFCKGDNIDWDCLHIISTGDMVADTWQAIEYFENNILQLYI